MQGDLGESMSMGSRTIKKKTAEQRTLDGMSFRAATVGRKTELIESWQWGRTTARIRLRLTDACQHKFLRS